MRKIVYSLLIALLVAPAISIPSQASLISDRAYRLEQRKENKQNIKQIKALFDIHDIYSNKHDLENLGKLYADSYINNDGFTKKAYFKSIKETWEACENLNYTTKILSIEINGDNATVDVEETATGTIIEKMLDQLPIAGEIHSKSRGIYHLTKINGNWYISGETSLADESSLLYGDARFMNIELQSPAQVQSGETYTVSLKIDADKDTYIVGSIDHDPVTYPTNTPQSELRPINASQTLERLIKANTDNINEYAIASMAISKVKPLPNEGMRIYMAGLACVMRRVNVVPKNNFIKVIE